MICNRCGINEANTHLCQQGETRLISKYPMPGWSCAPMCQQCAEKALSGKFCSNCGQEIAEQRLIIQAKLTQTAEGQWIEENRTVTATCPNCGAVLGRPANLNVRIVIG